ncbi:MAG TPA: alpha/beta hydrolase [Burkholderiaceae bacterium]|jgi:acetyl esterase|nr:alpha/beta hydrolase [Burkholderiaceae bacterium]
MPGPTDNRSAKRGTHRMRRWRDMASARQPMRRVLLDVGMHALAELADFLPRVQDSMAHCTLIQDIEYAHRGDVSLCLDIMQPQGSGPHPVLIYLHGGAFAIGSKRTHRAPAAVYAAEGYLVCNVDYRLAPTDPFPAAIADACAAWCWVVDHIGEYGGDPHRIALAGESAGANLALGVTLACCTQRPEPYAEPLFGRGVRPVAALLYYGFLQTSRPERYRQSGTSLLVTQLSARIATDAAHSYLGRFASQPDAAHALADPLCVVEQMTAAANLPPLFIAAGLSDPVAPDSQRLEQALQRLQSPHVAHYYPGETHAFHLMFWRKQAQHCWRDSFEFLRQYLPIRTEIAAR